MATPGYPQMGQMPPGMGGPPMGGPPMAGPPMGAGPRPMRRGVSRAVPVVISAGLAVGVFCGLLFGVGTGKKDANAGPSKGNNVKAAGSADMAMTPVTPGGETQNKIVPTDKIAVKGMGSNVVVVNGGSGAGSAVAAAGSGAGSAAVVAVKTNKLTIKVEPDAAATGAKIQIDGKEIEGTSIDLPTEKKSVKITVTSTGYHQLDKTVDILGDETTVELPLTKKGGGGGSPGFGGTDTHKPTVPTRPPGETKPKKKPGGLIDI
jgi:hypothetical protein